MPSVLPVLLIKLYAIMMLMGSSVLWFVVIRNAVRESKQAKLWLFFILILGGLIAAFYFVDGWRPLGK